MEFDMELACGTEDYEELQQYFEHRKFVRSAAEQTMAERLRLEYLPELEDTDEEDKINYRREAVKRIWGLLQEIPPNIKKSSISETKGKG